MSTPIDRLIAVCDAAPWENGGGFEAAYIYEDGRDICRATIGTLGKGDAKFIATFNPKTLRELLESAQSVCDAPSPRAQDEAIARLGAFLKRLETES